MLSPSDNDKSLSMRVSEVLDDIGVNEVMVTKRRGIWMLEEAIDNISCQFSPPKYEDESVVCFGSQTEGSTTEGLHSDMDYLHCSRRVLTIQDWSEWRKDKLQFMIVQDDTTQPGYCLLQAVKSNVPEYEDHIPNEYYCTDNKGRVLLIPSMFASSLAGTSERHGPAQAIYREANQYDADHVRAFHCSSWPKEADSWLHTENSIGWPTEEMKRYSADQGCFVVPVGSKTGINREVEWRISTSFAERCLMFSLNITQLRCYILLKMILKTFLKPLCDDAVSSFMCKTVLFYCIADPKERISWNDCSLIACLKMCLKALHNCISTENCPHFIIPRNNLLAGKVSADNRRKLDRVMCTLIENIEQSLLDISIDNFGERLRVKYGCISKVKLMSAYVISACAMSNNIGWVAHNLLFNIRIIHQQMTRNFVDDFQILVNSVYKLCQWYFVSNKLYQHAISIQTPFLCTDIGSMIASVDIYHSKVISLEAFRWFALGLNSDISSSRLKLASVLYCAGDLEQCNITLEALSRQLLHTVYLTHCSCYSNVKKLSKDYAKKCYDNNLQVLRQNMAFCVIFPCEINCIPHELKYEMFRSTKEDMPYKNGYWMNWAVVDTLPFLYFLQYMVNSKLQRHEDQQRALENLGRTIDTEPNLGHKETAWNLLGQCMEQELRKQTALSCYTISLRLRKRNNAAKWHICRLLARQFKSGHKLLQL